MRRPMFALGSILLAVGAALAQSAPPQPSTRAPPPPVPGQPERPLGNDPLSGMIDRLQRGLEPTDEVKTAVLTSGVAIKTCGFEGKERVDAVASAYRLNSQKFSKEFVDGTFGRLRAEIEKDKDAFCQRVLRLYGPKGTSFKGLLARPPTSPVVLGSWAVMAVQPEGAFQYCRAVRPGRNGLDMVLLGERGMFLLVTSHSLNLKMDKPYPVSLEVGSTKRTFNTDPLEKDQVMIPLDAGLVAQLRRSEALDVRVDGQTMPIAFKEKGDLIDALEKCYKAHVG